MGYEIKMYIGEVTSIGSTNKSSWFSVIGMLDLSKPGYESAIYRLERKGPQVHLYDLDGNTSYEKDRYDSPLVAIPFDDVLQAITDDAESDRYRRYHIAKDWLESVKKHFHSDRLAVVLYGH